MLTFCVICGEDVGIVLLGAACNKICQDLLGEPYKASSSQRLPDANPCERCMEHLKKGSVAFVAPETGRVVMITRECAERNNFHQYFGKVVQLSDAQLTKMFGTHEEASAKLSKEQEELSREGAKDENTADGKKDEAGPGANPGEAQGQAGSSVGPQ
jgi:hypothetical protein